jgi:hypothetical protein
MAECTFTHGDPAARCVTTVPVQAFFDIKFQTCACGELQLNLFVRPATGLTFLNPTRFTGRVE